MLSLDSEREPARRTKAAAPAGRRNAKATLRLPPGFRVVPPPEDPPAVPAGMGAASSAA
jgi:hypothetical protein